MDAQSIDTLDDFRQAVFLWLAYIGCTAAVAGLQFRAFGASFKSRRPSNVANFFSIDEILDRHQRTILAAIAAMPLTFLFLVLIAYSEEFALALMKFAHIQIESQWSIDLPWHPDQVPQPLYPLVIGIALFIVFGAQLSFLYRHVEKLVLHIAGVINRTDQVLEEFSSALLARASYADIMRIIEEKLPNRLPLAEELETSSDKSRLSFQLLHMAKHNVWKSGLRNALLKLLQDPKFDRILDYKQRIALQGQGNQRVTLTQVLAGVVIFIVACVVYLLVIPFLHPFFEGTGFSWPQPDKLDGLILSVGLVSIATVVPTVGGLVYYQKRAETTNENPLQLLIMVLAPVFIWSFVFNALWVGLWRVIIFAGMQPDDVSAGDGGIENILLRQTIYVFGHSLIPCMALLAIVFVNPKQLISRLNVAVAVLVFAFGHGLAQFSYEYSSLALKETVVTETVENADVDVIEEGIVGGEGAEEQQNEKWGGLILHQALLGGVLGFFGLMIFSILLQRTSAGARPIPIAFRRGSSAR